MPFGSQSNRAPGQPAASPAYPAAPPAGSSAACFHPAAAAKIPVSLRSPAPRQPPARPGLSIPAPHQKKPRAARTRKNTATGQHRPAVTLPSADALLVQQALQLVGAAVTLGTQSVSGAPIAQHHRKTQPVAVQNRPICTSFPSLGRPVNHPEAEYAPQFRNIHFRIASCQIDLVLIFPRRALRSSHSRILDGQKHERVPLFSYLYSAGQRERTPALSSARQLQHRVHMPRPELPLPRLDALHASAHHPLGQRSCLLCALFVLCVKSFLFPRLEQIVDRNSRLYAALSNQRSQALYRYAVPECFIFSREVRKST